MVTSAPDLISAVVAPTANNLSFAAKHTPHTTHHTPSDGPDRGRCSPAPCVEVRFRLCNTRKCRSGARAGTDYDVAPMAKVTGTAAALPAAALDGWAAGEEDYDVGASTGTLTLDRIFSFWGPGRFSRRFRGWMRA